MHILNVMNKTISNQAIFGEYKNAEDKVTAALLQVLHYGGHKLVCSVFADIDLPSNDINISPQVHVGESRPDGLVSCDCKFKIYIESKIFEHALNTDHAKRQLEANKKLSSQTDGIWMIYITPDKDKPDELEDTQIMWTNWQTIVDTLRLYETQDTLVKFLIEQFCLFVDHLVFQKRGAVAAEVLPVSCLEEDKNQRVIIVGGSWGEDVALEYGFYACQNGRFFHPSKYMAFYHKNRIKNLFEIVDGPKDDVVLTPNLVGDDYLRIKDPNYDGTPCRYFKLKHVKEFNPVIENDSRDRNGNICAFTYNQRYTTYDSIIVATKTSEL